MSENTPYHTPQEAKAWLKEQGFSIAGWSKPTDLAPRVSAKYWAVKTKCSMAKVTKSAKP